MQFIIQYSFAARDLSRIFVTIPRFTTGIPFTLGTVTNLPAEGGPQLVAYPRYSWHSSHGLDCNGITSAFRVAVSNLIFFQKIFSTGNKQ